MSRPQSLRGPPVPARRGPPVPQRNSSTVSALVPPVPARRKTFGESDFNGAQIGGVNISNNNNNNNNNNGPPVPARRAPVPIPVNKNMGNSNFPPPIIKTASMAGKAPAPKVVGLPPPPKVVGPPPKPNFPPPVLGNIPPPITNTQSTATSSTESADAGISAPQNVVVKRNKANVNAPTHAPSSTKLTNSKYDTLIQLLISPDLYLVTALCEITERTEMDQMAPALVNVFASCDQITALVFVAISMEVGKTVNSGTLFRGNSIASKVLSVYSLIVAKEYLQQVIGPPLKYIFNCTVGFEVNPEKIPAGETIEANMENLIQTTTMFFDAIVSSVSKFPTELRQTCLKLRKEVQAKFPESIYSVIGGFFFLRFICPAIITPDGFGVVDEVPAKSRRAMILVSKTLQNLANGVEFGKKEAYMIPLNSFIKSHESRLNEFFDELVDLPESATLHQSLSVNIDQKAIDTIHMQCYLNAHKISPKLETFGCLPYFNAMLQVLGTPPQLEKDAKKKAKKKKK